MFRARQIWAVAIFTIFGRVLSQSACDGNDHDPCRCNLKNGKGVVDLSFGNQDGKALFSDIKDPEDDTILYAYNPCYPFKSGNVEGLAVLFYNANGNTLYNASSSVDGDTDIGQQSKATFMMENDQLSIKYESLSGEFSSTVNLTCQDSSQNKVTSQGVDKTYTNYLFTLSGHGACPSIPASSNGLSGGSILLITCSVLLVVYLVGGIIYQRKRNDARGTDAIPNKDFWVSLPGLIKDGFLFIISKCKRETPTNYESV